MNRTTQHLRTAVLEAIGPCGTTEAVERLFELGLLSTTHCEILAMRRETERLVQQGLARCEAMKATARTFCCSYGKVRSAIYNSKI